MRAALVLKVPKAMMSAYRTLWPTKDVYEALRKKYCVDTDERRHSILQNIHITFLPAAANTDAQAAHLKDLLALVDEYAEVANEALKDDYVCSIFLSGLHGTFGTNIRVAAKVDNSTKDWALLQHTYNTLVQPRVADCRAREGSEQEDHQL